MTTTYNIYCDESGHLEYDRLPAMVLGAVWCPLEKTAEIAIRLREIKAHHGLPPTFEAKWGKVSPAQLALYCDLIDYFFDDDDLHFRSVIASQKSNVRHDEFGQDHASWYYKMYFDLLKVILSPQDHYRIYLDIKDTCSADKVRKLHDVLSNSMYDFHRRIITRIQTVRSHEVEQMQLADLLIGAVQYAYRELTRSEAKVALVDRVRRRSGYNLLRSTLLREEKFNLFVWHPDSRY